MDFVEQEEQEDDEMEMEAAGSYDSHPPGAGPPPPTSKLTSEMGGPRPSSNNLRLGRYRECLKNHAVGLGGHALDGCGEFLPAGPDGSLDALKCAACSCHRNFHRRDHHLDHHFGAFLHHHHYPPPYYRAAGFLQVRGPPPLALPSTSGEEDVSNNPGSSGGNKKRFRTKFTAEQRERMLALAERIGWRIQKHDEPLVQDFCSDTGVRRHVLKVWMHNNKHTLGKKP